MNKKKEVTSLTNNVFPLIRYKIGDIIKITKCDECECGLNGYVINEITGRQQNFIKLRNENIISEITIMSIVERVNSTVGNVIKEYKAQISVNDETVTIIAYIAHHHRSWEKKIKDGFNTIINQYFGYIYKSK